MQIAKMEQTVIDCECGTHMMKVQADTDYDHDGEPIKTMYLSMFSYHIDRAGMWERIKGMWKYLTTGKYFDDQMVMNPDEAKKLADFINKNLSENTP